MKYPQKLRKFCVSFLLAFALLVAAMPVAAQSDDRDGKDFLITDDISYSKAPAGVQVFPKTLETYSSHNTASDNHASYNYNNAQDTSRLVKEIRSELLQLPWYEVFDWLEFETTAKGEVTLRGQVTRPTLKSDAENVVKDIDGVTKVNNEIEVLPVSPNDDRLRVALYRAIYSGPLFRYQVGSLNAIHIIVKNGHVTLKGVVDSEGDKNIAGIRAKTVSGVFSVENELKVQNRRRG